MAMNACSSSSEPGSSAGADGGSSSGQPGKDGGGGGSDGGGGGSDAPTTTGDGSASCADTTNTVCDDFDQGTTINAKWTQAVNGGSAAIAAEGLSAPNALAVSINSGGGVVYVEKEFPFTAKVHCEMDMKLDAVPAQGDLDLFSITTKTTAGDYYVYFAHSAAGFLFAEFAEQLPSGGGVDKKQPITAPPTGSWFHVVFDANGTNATLTVNGATSSLTGLAHPSGQNRNVQVGTPFSQGTDTSSRALYDNVVCTFTN
jgi:hypothetical protein